MQRVLLFFMLAAALVAGTAMAAEPGARVGVRTATPTEIERRLQQREAEIVAEQPLGGLSRRLSHYLRNRRPDLIVLTAADATADNRRFASEQLGQPSPFVCHGDLDGNGLEDSIAILRERQSRRLRVMAFHHVATVNNPGNLRGVDYRAYDITEAGEMAPGARLDRRVVICNEPGRFEAPEGGIALELSNHSVTLGFYLYYFDGQAYRSLLIAD